MVHEWVERHLPWYDRTAAARADVQTRRIVRHAEIARIRAQRVVIEYERIELLLKEAR